MNAEQLQGKWHELKGTMRQRWDYLTDDDLSYIDGSVEKLVGRLQERYGIAPKQANAMVMYWSDPRCEMALCSVPE